MPLMSKNATATPVIPKPAGHKTESADPAQHQQKSSATLMRHWQLLQLLPARPPGATVTELLAALKNEFQVGRRTIERDLETLSMVFPLTCNDKSKPFGWYLTHSVQLPQMTLPEALLLHLAEPELASLVPGAVRPLLSPRLAEAERLVRDSAQSKQWQLSEKIAFLPTSQLQQAPVVDAEVLFRVQTALLDDVCLSINYSSPYRLPAEPAAQGISDKTKSRFLLHPLALVQNGMQLYLVAIVDGYSDTRLFAIQRISTAQVTEKPAERPADFHLQEYLHSGALQFVSEPIPFTLCAMVDPALARLLAEAPLGQQMRLEQATTATQAACAQGWLQLTTEVSDSWNLRLWLQSQGSRIEVVSPPWLRQQLQDELKQTLALYQR